jgi:NAD+ synthase (glutamine-hydrolysing)
MAKKLRITLAQLNLMVGDIQGNLKKLIAAANDARDNHAADIIVFPELCITGYSPQDLLYRKAFIDEANQALNTFKSEVTNIHCLLSHPYQTSQGLFNSCSLIYNGTILGRYSKQHLPNYGVFDERRYFTPGKSPCVIPINGIPVGIVICEDVWESGPVEQAATQGARLILSPNASPFEIDKHARRQAILSRRAKTSNIPIVYVANVGGQDEIIFDGGSMVVDQSGAICQHAGFFNETLSTVEIEFTSGETKIEKKTLTLPSDEEKIYQALVLGVRDYIEKNHFPGVIVGVSGGIDSALTLAIAVDALGKDRVGAFLLPSRYTADMSMEDGLALVNNLSVAHEIISIEPVFNSFIESLAPSFAGKKPDVTEENIQARCRGVIMMAQSNKSGRMVLTTGNRSEMAVGYATLYGDMAGGLAVLKDVPKTLVYRLAEYRNHISPVIPQRIIDRPPTAELAPDQKDEDTLPPYAILDKILECYINQEQGVEEIIQQGFDRDVVVKIVKMIRHNEYKRRQAPLGLRINHKAFGVDRRYPVTSGFKG